MPAPNSQEKIFNCSLKDRFFLRYLLVLEPLGLLSPFALESDFDERSSSDPLDFRDDLSLLSAPDLDAIESSFPCDARPPSESVARCLSDSIAAEPRFGSEPLEGVFESVLFDAEPLEAWLEPLLSLDLLELFICYS